MTLRAPCFLGLLLALAAGARADDLADRRRFDELSFTEGRTNRGVARLWVTVLQDGSVRVQRSEPDDLKRRELALLTGVATSEEMGALRDGLEHADLLTPRPTFEDDSDSGTAISISWRRDRKALKNARSRLVGGRASARLAPIVQAFRSIAERLEGLSRFDEVRLEHVAESKVIKLAADGRTRLEVRERGDVYEGLAQPQELVRARQLLCSESGALDRAAGVPSAASPVRMTIVRGGRTETVWWRAELSRVFEAFGAPADRVATEQGSRFELTGAVQTLSQGFALQEPTGRRAPVPIASTDPFAPLLGELLGRTARVLVQLRYRGSAPPQGTILAVYVVATEPVKVRLHPALLTGVLRTLPEGTTIEVVGLEGPSYYRIALDGWDRCSKEHLGCGEYQHFMYVSRAATRVDAPRERSAGLSGALGRGR